MDRSIIEQYAQGGDVLTKSIAGLTRADFTAFPVPGTWSIQQIVMHLMDSDLIASERMRRIIAEDNPLIMNYDETRFTERLHYHEADPVTATQLFSLNRAMNAATLRLLPDETFERSGIHSQRGKLTLAGLVQDYHNHLHHHLKFLHQKRQMLGKPIKL